jgi:protoporphyrinogen IX oxidase
VSAYSTLVSLHLFANMVWIGSICSVGVLLSVSSRSGVAERGRLALLPYRILATPAFMASLALGVTCLVLDPSRMLLRLPSMHAKLTLVAGVIVIHHLIGSRARKMAAGLSEFGPPKFALPLLVVCAAFAAWLAVVKPF